MADIVDKILPRRRVHLLCGPSGSGKTRFMLDAMVAWAKGQDFLGYKSFPEPWLYVAADRSGEEVKAAINALTLAGEDVPVMPAYAIGTDTLDWERVFNAILGTGRKVIVWEGFGRYVGANPKGHIVDRFIEQLTYRVQKHDLTLIGIVEQPKMKPKDRYGNPRQRISGPVAWGHHCSTVITIEPIDEDNPSNPKREIWVIPHENNVAPQRLIATLASGHVVVLPDEDMMTEDFLRGLNLDKDEEE